MSIFLFGKFEPGTVRAYCRQSLQGGKVIDIGANIGAHTLHLARCVGLGGQVLAIEPTAYAFGKMIRNIALNPELTNRILPAQILLTEGPRAILPKAIYSSWPLTRGSEVHPQHQGRLMTTEGAKAIALDDYLEDLDWTGIRFIKMDVDGNECAVLRGARKTLKRDRPTLLMEVETYGHEEMGYSLEEFLDILGSEDYSLKTLSTGSPLPLDADAWRNLVPEGCSINVLAQSNAK